MAWSLFDEKKGELRPRAFSNGKNQEDIVNEAVAEIKSGAKIIFIHGTCGSGKSAIALNIAKEIGRASIVVPIKNLQRQYENDYSHKKYLLKKNNEKLKISMITGRANHKCPYLEDNKKEIMLTRAKEKNASLFDIFENKQNSGKSAENDSSCGNPIIPCKIEIKSKNLPTLKKYYNENPEKKDRSELDLKVAKRFAVAPACPYWTPILNSEIKLNSKWQKKEYASVAGKHSIYLRKDGCPYYGQFRAYYDSDVVIFNSDQYLLETALGRKPKTEVEIIDECDEFLDSFALEGSINLTRLKNEAGMLLSRNSENQELIDAISEETLEVLGESLQHLGEKDKILELRRTKLGSLIKTLASNDLYEIISEDSYLEHCVEEAKKFSELIDEAFISFYRDKNKNDIFAKLVTTNLDKILASLIEKNKAFVFMSGTLHSKKVLEEVFGLRDFKIIEAETFSQGTIRKLKCGLENDFKFENFSRKLVSREQYLKSLDKCIQIAKIPLVVQVSAFSDLPSEIEIEKFGLKNLVPASKIIEQQNSDKEGKLVKEFKEGKTSILFTTRCSRGIDFPFETCNSVVVTKFPYPNTQSLFWKILKLQRPDIFWEFYKDKAHRELLQRVYRSVRAPEDSVFLLSPDIRVLNSKIF